MSWNLSLGGHAVFEARDRKFEVEKWVNQQAVCPTRKQTVKVFPDVPVKAIRSALQAREDRDRASAPAKVAVGE